MVETSIWQDQTALVVDSREEAKYKIQSEYS